MWACGPPIDMKICVIASSIKGNVKENFCPSTGSEEQLLDFQPLPAMKDA